MEVKYKLVGLTFVLRPNVEKKRNTMSILLRFGKVNREVIRRMKRLSGFSLMEMMIVLTIVAIVAAASAPMINKKMVSETESLWTNLQNGGSI